MQPMNRKPAHSRSCRGNLAHYIFSYAARCQCRKNCEGLLGNIERRRSTSVRSKNDAEISDILQGMRKLDNVENRPTFVAVDWKRLPKNVPDELDIFSIVERINDLDNLAKKQDDRITKNAEDVTKITIERPNVMSDRNVSDGTNGCMPTSEDETEDET